MKILYLITQPDWGGAQKYVRDLSLNLSKEDFEIEVAIGERKKSYKEEWIKDLENNKIKIHRLKHLVRELNLWHDFLSAFELYKLFLKSNPDIVHLNSSKVGSTGAVIAWLYKKAGRPNLKIVYTAHGFVFNEPINLFKRKFYLWSEKISGRFKDKIICVSEADKISGLNNKIAEHKKFVTIHNGIDKNEINFLEKDLARKKLFGEKINYENKKIVGSIAKFYSTKGIEYFIRSAKILKDKRSDLLFVVLGQGKLKKDLEKQIKKFDLEKDFLLIDKGDLAKNYLKAFDIFCLTSIKEGLPYVLIEALNAGLPIITTKVGGVTEIIEPDENGLVVLPKKPREISRAIEKLIDDEELKNKFSKNNLEKVKKFSLEKMIEKTVLVYGE